MTPGSRRLGLRGLVALGSTVALIAAGCGGNDEEDQVKRVVVEAAIAFAEGDFAAGCANFVDPATCEEVFPTLLGAGVNPVPPTYEIVGVEIDGHTAKVQFEDDPPLRLVEQDGWKIRFPRLVPARSRPSA